MEKIHLNTLPLNFNHLIIWNQNVRGTFIAYNFLKYALEFTKYVLESWKNKEKK